MDFLPSFALAGVRQGALGDHEISHGEGLLWCMLADERDVLTGVADLVAALNDFQAEESKKTSKEVSKLTVKTHCSYEEWIVIKEAPLLHCC